MALKWEQDERGHLVARVPRSDITLTVMPAGRSEFLACMSTPWSHTTHTKPHATVADAQAFAA